MIHIKDHEEIYTRKYIWIWLLSAFKAGLINSAGFLATGRFVSHVTGFGTQSGIAVGHDDFFFGAELLIIPFAFIFGGVITSSILDREYTENETPPYHLVQGLISILVFIVILLGETGYLSNDTFRRGFIEHDLMEFVVIALLCFICGLKNALVAWTTKGKIRVTHLTGISTDIGLHFFRLFKKKHYSPQFEESRKVNIIRICTFMAFSLGSFISAIAFPRLGYRCFAFAMFISLFMTALAVYDQRVQAKQRQKNLDEGLSGCFP